MTRTILLLCALALVAAASTSAAGPTASAARTCRLTIDQQRHSGATYLVQLQVTNVRCSTGLKVEKDWQACRRATAGHRTCRRKVDRYTCKQTVLDHSKTQYDARVVCTRASRAVKFIYTQNT